jgi:Zn-dependent peptidase ImmA (M78 family)
MAKISVSPQIIQWASNRSGLSLTALKKYFPKIQAWFDGTGQPTFKQIEKLAKRTNTPFGYFFLTEPPVEQFPIPYYRTITDKRLRTPSPNLLDTIYSMQQRQEWLRQFLIEEGETKLPFVASAKLTDNPNEVASKIRNVLGLTKQWATEHKSWQEALRALYKRIEEINIIVVASGIVGNNTSRKLNVEEFRGFVLYDDIAPLIFVNSDDGKAAQMFTLAHEIAHIWFGNSAAFDLRELQSSDDAMEQICNHVAAELLVPQSELKEIWANAERTKEPFQFAARNFKVSPLVAARRALDIKLITKKKFFDFYEAYQKDERRKKSKKSEGGDFWADQNYRIGRRFGETVVNAAKEGRLLFTEAYQLTGLSPHSFYKYAKEVSAA